MSKINVIIILLLSILSIGAINNETSNTADVTDSLFISGSIKSISISQDIVYGINPNEVPVYSTPEQNSDILSYYSYLEPINRKLKLSEFSYIENIGFVKNSDISDDIPNLKIKEKKEEVVFVKNESTNLYTKPSVESDIEYILYQGQEVYKIATLDNGWCIVEENGRKYFSQSKNLVKRIPMGKFQITYYCPCSICNGPYGAVDKKGNPLVEGTAAVDPSIIPLGSEFYINNNRRCVANDVGGAIKGNHIDIFVDVPHNVCENMGNGYEEVFITIPCE